MSLTGQLQKGLGRYLKQWYRVANRFKVSYTLIKDLKDVKNSKSILTIFLKKTPSLEQTIMVGGRRVRIKPSGGAITQEALPLFEVSRESLKIAGVFHTPTDFDSFIQVGTTEPTFYVKEVETIGEDAAGYRLTVSTIFDEYVGG